MLGKGISNVQFIVIGYSYKTAPMAIRERLAFSPGETGAAAARLLAHPTLLEAAILSTCHRMEIYAVASDPELGESEILRFLGRERGLPAELLERYKYQYTCQDAVEHLFRVASGLESLVLGESEVHAQVKLAFQAAQDHGATGALLNELFMQAAEVGKRVRAETAIARGHTSLASVAVEAIRQTFPDLHERNILVLGAGQIGESVVRLLDSMKVGRLYVANRTESRARVLCRQIDCIALEFSRWTSLLSEVDAIVVGTAAPHYLIQPQDLMPALEGRNRPLVCIDLSVPHNVDPAVAELPGLIWHDMNTLETVVRRALEDRSQAIGQAEELIQLQMNEFLQWFNGLEATPTIAALREILETIRQGEIERLGGRWSTPLNERDRETLESITRAIVQKILHGPAMRLKGLEDPVQRRQCLDALAALFGLEPIPYSEHYARRRGQARERNGRCPVSTPSHL